MAWCDDDGPVLGDIERRLEDTSQRLRCLYRRWLVRRCAVVMVFFLSVVAFGTGVFVWAPLAFTGFILALLSALWATRQGRPRQRRWQKTKRAGRV